MNKNVNEKFWNKYYKSTIDDINDESTFATYIHNEFIKNESKTIADLGCGNCRDSFYFARKGNRCYAIDCNLINTKSVPNCILIKENAISYMKSCELNFDIIYMRWFLHAMSYEDAQDVFNNSFDCLNKNGHICIEVRSINDDKLKTDSIYDNTDKSFTTTHKRWLYSLQKLEEFTKNKNCKIVEQREGFFSPNKNTETENPLLLRFVVLKL
jgi:SAM-dependent methyltransferase